MKYYLSFVFLFLNVSVFSQTDYPNGTCEDGKLKAEEDAAKGMYELLSFGFPFYEDWDFQDFYEKYTFKTYGIRVGNGGCEVSNESNCYMDRMRELITKKFGDNILAKAKKEAGAAYGGYLDSLKLAGHAFSFVDSMPQFKGGDKAFHKFLQKNLKDPVPKDTVHGKVKVQFTISEDGRVENVKIVQSLAPLYDDEVMRVLAMSPLWMGGRYLGRKVKVRLFLPISF